MAVVTLLERTYALVISNAGMPGIRLAHPNIELEASSTDSTVVELLAAMEDAAPAIWAVLEETKVSELMAQMQHRALTQLAEKPGERSDGARKALAAWPKLEDGSPKFNVSQDELAFVNVCGARVLDTQGGPSRQRGQRVTF